MGISLQSIILHLLPDIAVFAVTAIAYGETRRATAHRTTRTQQTAIGCLLGVAALTSVCLTLHLRPESLVTGGPVAAALAAPFGGTIAAATVAIMTAASLLFLDGPATELVVAQVFVGILAGIAVIEGLRREQTGLGTLHLILLAGLVPIGCLAVLGLSAVDLGTLPATTVLSLAVTPSTVMVVGLLLLRWDERDGRAAAAVRRFRALAGSVSAVLVQIAVKRSGEIGFPHLSPDAVRLLGVMAGEARADPAKVLQVIHKDDLDDFARSLSDAARTRGTWSHGFRIVQHGGRIRWLRAHFPPHVLPCGEVVFDGALVDVTSREEAENALRWSEELCRFLFENTSEIIARIGADDRWIYVPPSVRHILGYDPSELIGQSALTIVHPDEVARLRAALRRLKPGGAPLVTTYRARTRDGLYVWIEDVLRMGGRSAAPGSTERVSVIRRFDGSRAAAEPWTVHPLPQRAGARRGRFARMLEATSAGVMVSDPHRPDNPITFINAAAVAITGYEAAELSGRNARILQGPQTNRATVAEISAALQGERPVSATILNYRKNGTPFWSKLRISPVHGADGQLEAFVCVFFEVTEEKQLEEALRQACNVAEQANRAKSEFIANISHELRTPLNGVIGFTNLLLNENLPAEQRRYATFARDAGSSLLAIINNVLDLSKIEAGKFELSETDFSVIELAVSCNTVVWHAAREKGLDLNFVLKPDVLNVCRGDPDRIRQVLLNFLSNAIKFTEKGNVVLTIAKVEDRPPGTVLMLSVTDTGIGIPKEKQDLLFQKFSQIDEERSRQLGGTGLGLAICKSLVERMGGEIGVKSTPGVGSKFWFTVPLKPALGPGYRQNKMMAGPHRRARILLAEDTPMNQELMVTLLKRAGHDVTVVGDGAAALDIVKRQAFDLILMDVQLPRMNGLEATRAIRALDGGMSKVPIVAMTARALSRDVEECLAAGMDDHLSKPIDTVAMLAVIDHWARTPEPIRQPAAIEPAPAPRVHDETVLMELERHVGLERVAKMIAMAHEDIPARLARMQQSLSDRDLVGQEAHDLVSIAGNLGFLELGTQCRKLMTACAAPEEGDIAEAYDAVRSAADAAMLIIAKLHRSEDVAPADAGAA